MCFAALLLAPAAAADDTPAATAPAAQKVFVRAFRFTGNTVFTDAQLQALVADYAGKQLTLEMIDDARRKVSDFYVNNGYPTSGAILPPQTIGDEVWIQVIEGKLEKLSITGNTSLRNSYFSDRLAPALRAPLRLDAIEAAMATLQQDPRIASVQGRVTPGSALGLANFDLDVHEARPYQVALQFDNAGTPSTGAERLALLASDLNLTGVGDALALRFGPFAGGVEHPHWAPGSDLSLEYSRPLIGDSTFGVLSLARNDLSLVQPPLAALGSDTATDSVAVALQQTLWHTPGQEATAAVALSWRDNRTTLLGQPFSFSDGAVNGYMATAALRTSLAWTHRSETFVFSARSTLSIGLDAMGATIHDDGEPDSRFLSWLGETQSAWRIKTLDATLLSRAAVQLSDARLLALEQYALGGVETVRGYRESKVLSDEAALGSLELRKRLFTADGMSMDGALFSDVGYGWDHGRSREGELLASVGCGVLFELTPHVQGQVYYGYPLTHRGRGGNLEDLGVHFQILIKAF